MPETGDGIQVASAFPLEDLTSFAANDHHLICAGHVRHVGKTVSDTLLLTP
jgi:hypothetical protein